jgi:hypothetical protein
MSFESNCGNCFYFSENTCHKFDYTSVVQNTGPITTTAEQYSPQTADNNPNLDRFQPSVAQQMRESRCFTAKPIPKMEQCTLEKEALSPKIRTEIDLILTALEI